VSKTAADVMIETLCDWGVDRVFGLPGDGINGIMESLRKYQDRIKFIQVRHEEAAAFMACGYAKFTGKMGVCLATSGPGGIHLLNGLYDAKFDGQPVLALTGMHHHDLLDTHAQQDVNLDRLFEDVAIYNARVMGPEHVENVIDLACRKAYSYRGVAHITMPVDFQSMPAKRVRASERNIEEHTSSVRTRSYRVPSSEDMEKAARILNEGRKIGILVGQGALGAEEELVQIAEILGAPIAKALLGKAVLPDDSIYTTGSIGLLGTRPSQEMMEGCDTLLMIGTSFPYIEFLPKSGQARAVQIDVDPSRIGLRYSIEVGLVGDSKETLKRLLPMLRRNDHRRFLEKAQLGMKDWWKLMKEQGTRSDTPMKPQVVAWELGKRLSDRAMVSCDSGTIATWWARQIPHKTGQMHTLSGTLASMACGLPYAIAAQIAHPGRQSVAFIGDGGFTMLMAEFLTCVKYRLPVKIVIINNSTLGQIKWEQMVFLGNPEYGCELQGMDFAMFAEACGAKGFTIERPEDCGFILDEALETPGPVIVNAIVDQNEPPMPAKISPDQALKFGESLMKGNLNRGKIALTATSDMVRKLV
jgi:pyruvate dehydrogenase (quinone)